MLSEYDLSGISNPAEVFRVPYEELIVSIGAHNQTFNIPGKYLTYTRNSIAKRELLSYNIHTHTCVCPSNGA